MSSEATSIVQRGLWGGLLAVLRERRPAILYLGKSPWPDLAAAARALGARIATRLSTADSRPQFDVLVVAPGTVTSAERPKIERALALARQWGVPTLIDATGAGARASRTATVRRTIRLALWPVIRATDAEAAALTSSARSSKPSRHGRDLSRLASALVRRGGIAVVTGKRTVVTDGARALTVHNGDPDLTMLADAGRLATAVLGAFLGVAHRADFLTAAVVGLACLGLAAERAAKRAHNRRSLKAQLLRELAAITAEDLHKSIRTTERRLRTAARSTRRTVDRS